MTLHMLDTETEEALCGATLLDPKTTHQDDWDWTEDREEADCATCTDLFDEDQFDRAQRNPWEEEQAAAERAAYLDELALDDAVNESRGIYC